jgi:hypothetical protein
MRRPIRLCCNRRDRHPSRAVRGRGFLPRPLLYPPAAVGGRRQVGPVLKRGAASYRISIVNICFRERSGNSSSVMAPRLTALSVLYAKHKGCGRRDCLAFTMLVMVGRAYLDTCEYCSGKFGLVRQVGYYACGWPLIIQRQFCSGKCKDAYDQDSGREFRIDIIPRLLKSRRGRSLSKSTEPQLNGIACFGSLFSSQKSQTK